MRGKERVWSVGACDHCMCYPTSFACEGDKTHEYLPTTACLISELLQALAVLVNLGFVVVRGLGAVRSLNFLAVFN